MDTLTFTLMFSKETKTGFRFREGTNRIGQVYLPTELAGSDRVTIEVAATKEAFTSQTGYLVYMIPDKETKMKIRYKEKIGEQGLVSEIYIGKDVLDYLHINWEQEIAVRICPAAQAKPIRHNMVACVAD